MWSFDWTCEKWSEDACDLARKKFWLPEDAPVSSALLRRVTTNAEAVEYFENNLLVNAGIQKLEDLLIGAGGPPTAFNNGNSRLGVGNSATAEAATQTDLSAAAGSANRQFKVMNATFPSRATNTISWQSDFTSGEANFVWNEWCVDSGTSSGVTVTAVMLNRKVASLGTKATGTWTLTGTLTIS